MTGASRRAGHVYSVYGLTVASDVELPELTGGSGVPDIVISQFPGESQPPDLAGTYAFHGGADDVTLEFPQTATITVHAGREIVVRPRPGVDTRTVRAVLLGPALAVLLHQRGVLALHASSVLHPRGVVGFLGGSGWGKSTMAGGLERRGCGLVADDITAVQPAPATIDVLPSFPQLKLWPEAAEALGLDPVTLPRVVAAEEKRARRVPGRLPEGRLQLASLYVLADGEHVRVEPLAPREALIELVRHSFCARRLAELGATRHFLQCGEVARRVPVRRLVRPRNLALLDTVADLVLQDVARAP
jgi:hypothetical protein